jgi:D-glycero-D-manno-heptose 1,7-bisphosphate phosphatase
MKTAVFLDRDGTLNKNIWRNGKPTPPYSCDEVELINGTQEAISKLRKLNYIPIIITNQPDISRGKVSLKEVNKINDVICEMLKIDYVYMCTHDDSDGCECRKPKPGMIHKAAVDLELTLNKCILIGDRWRDIHAGQAVGCKSYLIENNYDEPKPNLPYETVLSVLHLVKKLEE